MITSAEFLPLAPEIFVLSATCVLLLVDLFLSDARRGLVHFLGLLTLVAAAVITLREDVQGAVTVFNGMFVRDLMGDVLKLTIYLVTGAAFVYAKPYLIDRGLFKGEFYTLCVGSPGTELEFAL